MHRLLDAGLKVHPKAGGCHSYLLERPDMLRELLTPDVAGFLKARGAT
jgi:hypothetical protein